jgi:hypothetical protein
MIFCLAPEPLKGTKNHLMNFDFLIFLFRGRAKIAFIAYEPLKTCNGKKSFNMRHFERLKFMSPELDFVDVWNKK